MKKYILILIAIVLVAGASAFTIVKSTKAHKKTATTWYFDGTAAQIKQANHWRNTGSENTDCTTSSGTRPCAISVEAADQEELQDVLTPLSVSTINSMSPKKRP